MATLRQKPKWFRFISRCLATLVVLGLGVAALHEIWRLPIPLSVVEVFGFGTLISALGFLALTWQGVWLGYTHRLDAIIYTAIFVVAFCWDIVRVH